jgi:plastocyanin
MAVSMLAAGLAPRAAGGLIPGGGPQRSDCYLEIDVQGIDNPGPQVQRNRVVQCAEGDPCDTDGVCGNDACTLQVAVCIAQTDPNLAACAPPTGEFRRLAVNFRLQAALPPLLVGPACGTPVGIAVPLRVRANGKKLPGKVALPGNATAAPGTRPARDRDKFVLQCVPRTSPCPGFVAPPTTTTTTIPGMQMHTVVVGPGGSFTFDPQTITIRAGETVRWRFASIGHNVVSGSGGTPNGLFCSPDDSGCGTAPLASNGDIYEHTFPEPGTFPYFCTPHVAFGMTGRVIVEP